MDLQKPEQPSARTQSSRLYGWAIENFSNPPLAGLLASGEPKDSGRNRPSRSKRPVRAYRSAGNGLSSGRASGSVGRYEEERNTGKKGECGSRISASRRTLEVDTHDFPDKELGKAIPYGVYDIDINEAWVSVGVSRDTAEFAVEAIRRWWKRLGKNKGAYRSVNVRSVS